jgi:hypothetical protein
MAVFVAAADESAGGTNSFFYWGGLLGPERKWSESFAPAWESEVLHAPPPIEFLHQTDIRNRQWQAARGLSPTDAEKKLDAAWNIVDASGWLYPIAVRIDNADFHDTLKSMPKLKSRPSAAPYRLEPDYICFILFAHIAIRRVFTFHPDCEKVDFIVERKRPITSHVQDFHDTLTNSFLDIGKPELARLVGDFIPAGKERVPLQAADLLCWYENRIGSVGLNERDKARHRTLSKRKGARYPVTHDEVQGLRERLEARLTNGSSE